MLGPSEDRSALFRLRASRWCFAPVVPKWVEGEVQVSKQSPGVLTAFHWRQEAGQGFAHSFTALLPLGKRHLCGSADLLGPWQNPGGVCEEEERRLTFKEMYQEGDRGALILPCGFMAPQSTSFRRQKWFLKAAGAVLLPVVVLALCLGFDHHYWIGKDSSGSSSSPESMYKHRHADSDAVGQGHVGSGFGVQEPDLLSSAVFHAQD